MLCIQPFWKSQTGDDETDLRNGVEIWICFPTASSLEWQLCTRTTCFASLTFDGLQIPLGYRSAEVLG